MSTKRRVRQLESCSREMFGDLILTRQTPPPEVAFSHVVQAVPVTLTLRKSSIDHPHADLEKRRASDLVEELLVDIYSSVNGSDYNSATSTKSHRSFVTGINHLQEKGTCLFGLLTSIWYINKGQGSHNVIRAREAQGLIKSRTLDMNECGNHFVCVGHRSAIDGLSESKTPARGGATCRWY
jgi:hypothetical protein